MFKITKNATFTHTVTIPVPVDGGHDNQSMQVTYRVLTDDQIKEYDLNTTEGQKDFLRGAIVSLGDLIGADEKPIRYNDTVRDSILALSYARPSLLAGYSDAMVPALVKN
ncbi:MAG: hypothetical protein COA78_38305 [Blastopirellula sp.]|nr:MAG: hypothetical protein COA78_38305 [Blastopirellula sp.]